MATEHLHYPPRALPMLQVFLDPSSDRSVLDVAKAIIKSFDGRTLLRYQLLTRQSFLKALQSAKAAEKGAVDLARRHELKEKGGPDTVLCREWLIKVDRNVDEPYTRGSIPLSYRSFAQAWDAYRQTQEQEWISSAIVSMLIIFIMISQMAYSYVRDQNALGGASNQVSQDIYHLMWHTAIIELIVTTLVYFTLFQVQEPSLGLEALLRLSECGPGGFMVLDLVFSMPVHFLLLTNLAVMMELIVKLVLSSGRLSAWFIQVLPVQTPTFAHLILKMTVNVLYAYPVLLFAAMVWCLGLSRSIRGRTSLIRVIQSHI